jgi:hypothetical protein
MNPSCISTSNNCSNKIAIDYEPIPIGSKMIETMEITTSMPDFICSPWLLEPTPIEPSRINVVKQVQLDDTHWIEKDAFIKYLLPLAKLKTVDDIQSYHSWSSRPFNEHKIQSDEHTIDTPNSSQLSGSSSNGDSHSGISGDSRTSNDGSSLVGNFRESNIEKWSQRFEDLLAFRGRNGNCLVPLEYPQNPTLAHWIKRQRGQYKAKVEGRHSTLTSQREEALEKLGFIWDSHRAAWEERLNEIVIFRERYGHCNVPSKYPENPQLSIWVKCQRRQHKLCSDDKRSNMTQERISKLADLGFVWTPRQQRKKPSTAYFKIQTSANQSRSSVCVDRSPSEFKPSCMLHLQYSALLPQISNC